MEQLKNVKIAPDVHTKMVDHCKNRPIPIPIGAWTAQAILEKIERETSKEEPVCQN
jgi:2-keto-3-deoxy-6-phosphogluconate aldolase